MKLNLEKLICFITVLIVFVFYAHTINYSWKHFDEDIIFRETILPIPGSFSEIFEIIKSFGLSNHFEASNPFYSNISNVRGTPVDVIFCLFIFWLFKKSALSYHFFILLLHLLNTCFCFLILNKTSLSFSSKTAGNKRLFLVSIITLLWSLHPVNVESVLFVTNVGALVTYLFCFVLFFYFINSTKPNGWIIFFLYLFPLLLNEYTVTFPFVLTSYLIGIELLQNKEAKFKDIFFRVVKKITPLLFALLIFVIYYVSLAKISQATTSTIPVTLERIFWFFPQVFFHYVKLIFFPIQLSIDQSALVKFSTVLFEPYAIFCILLTFSFILLSIRTTGFFVLFVPFFLSLLPFLHIISPIYNMASERYLYFPLFFLLLGFANVLFLFFQRGTPCRLWRASPTAGRAPTIMILLTIVCLFSTQAYMRTLDWKDSISLLKSAIKIAPNNLFKALRQEMLSTSIKTLNGEIPIEEARQYTKRAIQSLKKAKKEFKTHLKYQDKIPRVLKFYGLDPKTQIAKSAFLRAYCEIDLMWNPNKAYKIISLYVKYLLPLDTQILDFYYKVLIFTKNYGEADEILKSSLSKNKISPILYIALSDFQELRYNDLKQAEHYLKEAYKYFPYDPLILYSLKRLNQKLNNLEQFAFFSYLFGF